MKKILLTILPLSLLSSVYAAGLVVCGELSECTIADFWKQFQSMGSWVIQIAIIFIIVIIVYAAVKMILARDKVGELNEAKKHLWNVAIGIAIIVAITVGGYVAILKTLGVNDTFLHIFNGSTRSSMNLNFFERAYADNWAQTAPYLGFATASPAQTQLYNSIQQSAGNNDTLPNPLSVNTITGFLILVVRLVIRWFVFPVIIFAWFFTGFKFVAAQGNPTKLNEARSYLWWTLIGTVIILLAQGFAYALRDTINQIFS